MMIVFSKHFLLLKVNIFFTYPHLLGNVFPLDRKEVILSRLKHGDL